MNGTGRQRPAFANPVLLGAVTVLVAIVAVFLAYNANSGLPFVPTRELKVDIPNGAALLPGNQVLAGGYDVGTVSDMHPVRLANGSVGAQAILQLNTADGKVRARGKAWPTGGAEPSEWLIDKVDPIGNREGAPGFFVDAEFGAYLDNLKLTAN